MSIPILLLQGVPQSFKESVRSKAKIVLEPYAKVFPDGEQYVRIEGLEKCMCTVIQSTYPNQDNRIVELLLALEALKGLEAKPFVVLLYAAYARQDKRFLKGEPISVEALYKPLVLLGCEKLIIVDAHAPKSFESLGIEFINIVPHGYLIEEAGIQIDFVLAPDKGAIHRAKELAQRLNVPYDNLDKYRDRVTGEISIKGKELDVKDARVAIVDDIVSTGGTLAKAVEELYKAGASKVVAVVTHALMVGSAVEKIERSGLDALITANTVTRSCKPKWLIEIDISELVLEQLAKLVGRTE